jgi:plasmid maintenance system antidote protein VapI
MKLKPVEQKRVVRLIREEWKYHSLTQMAVWLGVNQSQLSHMLAGKRSVTMNMAVLVAEVWQLEIDKLLGRKKGPCPLCGHK